MTHPTLEDAARALCDSLWGEGHADIYFDPRMDGMPAVRAARRRGQARMGARAVLLSIRPPDREDLSLRQLEARDYIDGILNG